MDIEEKIKNCEDNLNQIKNFNPDPYYVNYFLKEYLQSVQEVYDGIFKEASSDFGLFVYGKCTQEKFELKAKEKNDNFALEFLSWFQKYYKDEHENPYPIFIKKMHDFFYKYSDLPKISIKILANQKYRDDIVQQINIDLTKGKIRSKNSLKIEIRKHLPIFLELINRKRKNKGEPKVSENNVFASSFLELQNYEEVEIPYACEIYLPVMKRIVKESRKKIKKLVSWNF